MANAPSSAAALLAETAVSVPAAMRDIVGQIPDQIAVDDGTDQITYSELFGRANQVANAILDRDSDPSVPVALLCGHGIAPVISLCSVLHAGRIGTSIDAREPADRLESLLRASGATLVVTDREHVGIARALVGARNVIVHDETLAQPLDAPPVEIDATTPGLVLFTSGSTGTPKGVVGAHADIVPRAARARSKEGMSRDDRAPLTTSYGFTAAEGRVFGVLLNGATMCTYDLRTRGPRGFADWAEAQRVTMAWFVPSVLRAIADSTEPVRMESVQRVSFGGETLYWRDVRRARELFAPDTPMKNGLGSTEAGGLASYLIPPDIDADDGPVPVGSADPTVELTLVDEDWREVADGEPGRIVVVRRDGRLALGYWQDPELTAAHFFVTPDGRRGFRTPDLARWRPDGLLEHLQRIDSRVKVRGAMVATSTVEQTLIALPDVADAAVIGVPADDGGTRLVAYVVARRGAALSAWKLRRDVARRLPSTYVPSAFVALDELPRTVRTKIDRAALPPAPPVIIAPYREGSGQHRELCEMFADILGVERVGLDDDFFDLGGDSLGVVELVAAISERFGVDIPASLVLDAPTVAELAPRLTHRRDPHAPTVVPLRSEGVGSPFFCFTGGGAPAISLRTLSETLECPFYGIQPRGLEERAFPDHSVAAAARRALGGVRAAQSMGPYILGGYSFGGLVAFELACRLVAAGERIRLLVILDTPAPGQGRTRDDRLRVRAATLQRDTPDRGVRRHVVVAGRVARFAAKSAAAHAERRIALTSAGLLPRRGLDQYELFLRLNGRMAREYSPGSVLDAPTLVVRSAEGGRSGARALDDLGWSERIRGPITVAEVSSDHLGLLRRPAVVDVGAHLRAAFDEVSRQGA
jgi:acyl-coenzyme A synthetase/AMP-(fatty) acid ligase/thioesterase domain-containing protein/acyl carrier protein